ANVTINALPTITGTLSACVGSTIQLSGNGIAATTNAWESSNTAVATISATGLVTSVASGTTTITYTNSTGCQTTASTTIIALPTITGTLSACVGSTTQLIGTSTAATSNAWTTSNSAVAIISNTAIVTGVASGTTTITYTNSTGCQTTVNVTINTLPTITGTLNACVGNTIQLTGTATAATSNAWTTSNSAVATISNTGIVTGVASGTTTITYTNSNGCQTNATVTISPLAIPNVNFSYAQVCINSATSPLPILTTNFVNGGVFSSSTLNVNATTGAVNLNTATSGIHQITYTLAQNTANCTAAGVYTASIVITAGLTPVTTFNYNSINCANAINQIPVTAFEFYTGGVYSSTNGLSINSNTGEINFVQSTPGNYTVTYTVQPNPSNCNSGGSSSISISILNPLNYSIDVICQGQSLALQVIPTNNSFNVNDVNYSWTNSTNNPIGTNNAVFNIEDYLNQNPNLNLPQTFNISVRLNGCSYSSNITVTNNPCKIIPRGISPNNDQVNDAFDLTGLGVIELSIYNRYGTKVYSFNGNYSDQWSGLSNDGNDLPDGTYFYSIQKADNTNVTGWVYINRQY
ncbi:gliding motility-associated C-terminal domain-containing protein, partial [Flavobacterium sp.]|uniref:T9SS type B sorting domain-containing protein n=1 Tax=Flavobacterium sp. TaxID=239 RepID=UPI003BBE34C0